MSRQRDYRGSPSVHSPIEIHNEAHGQSLCSVCERLNLERYRHHQMSVEKFLGTWREMVRRASSCPFCRLVVQGLVKRPDREPLDVRDRVVLSNHLSWELGIEMSPYDRLKSVVYSNKFDLRSMAKNSINPTYRLIVQPEGRSEDAAFIQYVESPDSDYADEPFCGRRVDRDKVDVDLLKSWLRRCEHYHNDVCQDNGTVGARLPYNLRLIDVEKRVIVRAPSRRIRFLTLSYVWGTSELAQTTDMEPVVLKREDIRNIDEENELTPLQDRLPQTIEDSVTLTRQLGFRYLWVDALCIIQDDSIEEKTRHLACMDAIYNCSEITIVAASGAHAHTGLSGISVPRRKSQNLERIRSLSMGAMSPSFTDLENCRSLVWNTRAWTFQEKVFAKRILLFTDYQVYFRCSESVWTEEVKMETKHPSKSIEARAAKFRWAADREPYVASKKLLLLKTVIPQFNISDEWSYLGNFPDFAAAIREYSQRGLTNPEDKLLAIGGILRSLQADAGEFLYGLPEAYFLQSVLWHPEPGTLSIRENPNLPAWTWAGWHSGRGVVFDVLDIRVIRTILLLIRNAYFGTKKFMNKLFEGSGTNSSGSSGDTSGSSSSSSSTTDTGSGSGQTGPVVPPIFPGKRHNWTTINAMGKASVNIFACFGWPLLFRHHTVKQIFLYDNGTSRRVKCEESLTLSAFAKDEHSMTKNPHRRTPRRVVGQRGIDRYRSELSKTFSRPVLSIRTVVVEYPIGACLQRNAPQDNNEVGCFELIDQDGACIGEVWTTQEYALKGRNKALEFLTISWGLSFTKAEIARKYVPRWDFDAAVLPKSKTKILMTACRAFEEIMKLTSSKHLSATYGLKNSATLPDQPSLMSFFDALLTARKNEPRPKFLWSTVNLLLVEHVRNHGEDGKDQLPVYRRAGVSRVIFDAWLVSSSLSQVINSSLSREIILE